MIKGFDYISDVHLDSWLRTSDRRNPVAVRKLIMSKFLKNVVGGPVHPTLVIAGDISHSNELSAIFLKVLAEEFYNDIVVVPGNHDMASRTDGDNFGSYVERLGDLENRLSGTNGAHLLLGNAVVIDGVRYGGTVGWYDYTYSIKKFSHTAEQGAALFRSWWDHHNIKMPGGSRMEDFLDFFAQEYKKVAALVGQVDVMITHMGPVDDYIAPKYQEDPYSGFFYFDGRQQLSRADAPEVWVYGHTHLPNFSKFKDTVLLCNPYGYKGENPCPAGVLSYVLKDGTNNGSEKP